MEVGLVNLQLKLCLWLALCLSVVSCLGIGCSSEHYKAEADEEVYSIIDTKWQEGFGAQTNYRVSDMPPSPNEIRIDKIPVPPDTISLAEAAAIATANNRSYQRQKENLYLSALALTGIRYDYERKWFATIDGTYIDDSVSDDEFFLRSSIETEKPISSRTAWK